MRPMPEPVARRWNRGDPAGERDLPRSEDEAFEPAEGGLAVGRWATELPSPALLPALAAAALIAVPLLVPLLSSWLLLA